MTRYLILDYETRSKADIKKVGGFEYATHPSTQILCAAWRLGTRKELATIKTEVWSPAFPGSYKNLRDGLCDPSVVKVAHNALFEQLITRFVLTRLMHWPAIRNIPIESWRCTAAIAAALALPRKLEGACAAVHLDHQKDMEGHRLMLKLSKPRKATKNNSALWHNSRADLERVMKYCVSDVDAETELFLNLPGLPEKEQRVWCLDQRINQNGFLVDRELVGTTLKLIGEETAALNAETRELTEGALSSTNQRAAVLKWLTANGSTLLDLRAKTVSDAIAEKLVEGPALRLLEIRQAISKTSTAKYQAFEMRSRRDGRLRDILKYHAASTGRWGGVGVQPQNFPRGNVRDTQLASEIVKLGDLELIRMIYGDPMTLFSSCLRAGIIAPEGKELFCGDYAAIEVRVLFWLANHQAGLQAYLGDRDLYREIATAIYRKPLAAVTKPEREVGKRAVLGCGFGMGWKKFMETCKQFGQEVVEEIAQTAVTEYRRLHAPVPAMWSNLERAAIAATANVGKKYAINKTRWFVEKGFLYCELPSGRRLAYYQPEIRYDETPWGEKRATLYHWGENPKTKKWECAGTYGGRLTENVVQATARDLMAEAMLRMEPNGFEVVLSVHDELVAEGPTTKSVEEYGKLMSTIPSWAAGCPVKVESWKGPRYKK